MTSDGTIRFPGLGIVIRGLSKGFSVFGYHVAFYGILLTLGMIAGYFLADWNAKRLGKEKDHYIDLVIIEIITCVIGARIYYVIFAWDRFKDNIWSIFNLRTGGMAIYGSVIAGILTLWIYCKKKGWKFLEEGDILVAGLTIGQIIGRWGNFVNREAFGDYTNGLFRMLLPRADVTQSDITQKMLDHLVTIDGVEFISVHPTFFYEQVWNIGLLIILLVAIKHKKFDGEIFYLYLAGYGLGRTWIESLRTDQLKFWGTNVAVSEVLSFVLFLVFASVIIIKRVRLKKSLKK